MIIAVVLLTSCEASLFDERRLEEAAMEVAMSKLDGPGPPDAVDMSQFTFTGDGEGTVRVHLDSPGVSSTFVEVAGLVCSGTYPLEGVEHFHLLEVTWPEDGVVSFVDRERRAVEDAANLTGLSFDDASYDAPDVIPALRWWPRRRGPTAMMN